MNSETRFARSRIRGLMPALEAAGLSAQRIADAAGHLSRARAALELATEAVLARAARADGSRVLLDAKALAAAPREMGLRALAALADGGFRRGLPAPIRGAGAAFRQHRPGEIWAGGATLHGCRLVSRAPSGTSFSGRKHWYLQKKVPGRPQKGLNPYPLSRLRSGARIS